MPFCGLTKEISPKICILYDRVNINKRSFEPFCVWIVIERSRVRVPAGAARVFSSPGSTICADSYFGFELPQ